MPAGLSLDPRAGLVRVDDRAATHRLPDGGIVRPRPLDQPLQRVLDATPADRESEHVPTDLHQPLVPDVLALVQVAQQRLDPRAERPPRLESGRIGAGRLDPAVRTGHGVLPALDHHRPHGWQLDDLAASDAPSTELRQRLTTARTRARAALDDHVRHAAHPTDPDVPALRTGLPTSTGHPVRLLAPRRRH